MQMPPTKLAPGANPKKRTREEAQIQEPSPCLRLSLDDVQAFRAGNSRVGQFRSTLPTYRWSTENPEIRRIRISFQFPPSILTGREAPSLLVTCREFLPSTEDQLTNTVVSSDGDEITINFPAYACLSLAEARRYAQSRTTIVSRVLKVHYANFLSENHLVIVGPETLGIEAVNNSKFQENGRVLAPWSIDAQMDVLYIAYFQTHMKHVISGLKKLIFSRDDKRETWYEIFLAIFVLLSNLESVHECQVSYIQRFCKSNGTIFAAANQVKEKMIEEWQQSAKNLIYHFRVVIKGTLPFAQTWTEDMQEKAGIDNKSMDYIKRISSMAANRREELLKLCTINAVEQDPKPLMWIASLFLNS
ncbi:hypothetical protein E8E14_002226 [Neopestalotiopsis sp. 37M]|nr:hypothetical protein E8E14_002226 [Neopestalotiopsis sp. 37M]